MILDQLEVDDSEAVAIEVGGSLGMPKSLFIVFGGANATYLVNKGAVDKSDPSMAFSPGSTFSIDTYGGERLWFICDTAETATLTYAYSEV